ncbi:MAG TPA: CheR family methyltransferase [Pyrinomonadaceae bacterium]|nr:CheR family methyltransferase [Pyrinomonadaceae bacterium]
MTDDTIKSGTHNEDLVVVGSSAGGVGALSTLVGTLTKSFPAPIVIAQHLDPQRPSHLGSILERRSVLPIVVVSEHEPTKLEGGKIYVVPANRHVKIDDGHVHLEADHGERPKPSVDRLLSSAAKSYGEHLIAVILTGAGSDGAVGAVDVKNAGGVVIIQNPQTAPYPSMPLSLPPTAVDHVMEMEQIGPLLFDILQGTNLPVTERVDDPLRELLTQVSARTNIDFRNYKSSTILRRIGRRMAVTHNGSIVDYSDYLRTHPDEVKELVKAFLIKVTGFFRDPEAFEFLKDTVIPALIDRAKANGRTLRVWSAGCATGEEAYSLALLIADHLGPDFPEWNVRVFATDLAADAISFARRGLYPENVLNDMPPDYQDRFFERVDQGFRISKSLRQAVIFGQQDISRGVPFPRIDLVACRNLLIYLKPDLQQVVLDLFAYSLHQSHGYLFLGKAETARPTKATFELINKRWKVYRCLGGPLAFTLQEPSVRGHSAGDSLWREARPQSLPAVTATTHELTPAETEIAQLRRINETMLRYTNVAVVIIDRQYRILTINAAARRLLAVRDIAYDQDFLHTVRGLPYQEVRRAIDTCFREQVTMNLPEIELDQSTEGSGRYVSLTVMAIQVEPGAAELAVITTLDITEQIQIKKKLEAVQREQIEMVGELSAANKRFGAMNKELQDANEELQAANEELMLTQEELQATNEEFEATNEELQATNEELETNNEELQATNEELQTTNDELTARTVELQELSRQRQVAQLQLSALLERYPHYLMILNAEDLTIQSINPNYEQLLGNRNVIGLPMSGVFHGQQLEHLIKRVQTAVRESKTMITEPILVSVDGEHHPQETRFLHTIVPIVDPESTKVARLFLYSEKVDD